MNHYVVGRWATLAGLMPAYGNQFHLAVEMYLKGALVEKGFAPDQLRRFGHNLKRLWKARSRSTTTTAPLLSLTS
jgi:hypothetical protein